MTGILYIAATPIGNLKDITLRAIEALKAVDLIACEDTRHAKKLLTRYDIHKPLTSYFQHNQIKKADFIIEQLKAGKAVGLISDAGTPGISDPGYVLIKRAIAEGIKTELLPGPCALIAALVLSGLPADRFVFEGFLPNKSSARRRRLAELKGQQRTVILYESPHRILKALKDMAEILPDHKIVCARELTKVFEEVFRADSPKEALEYFNSHPAKGEFVIMISGAKV